MSAQVPGYTKLFQSILASTIWSADDKTRLVWITLMAMADQNGVAEGSIPGLATFARVSLEDCERALRELESPDPYSRTKAFEGRRIETIEGGWRLVNHRKYREKMNADDRREYLRKKQAERRAKRKAVNTTVNSSQQMSTPSTHAEADTYTDHRSSGDDLVNPKRENPSTSNGNGKSVSLSPAARSSTDSFTDTAITERAGRFIERYESMYQEHRKGARYAVRPVRDYAASVTLCTTWRDDARLDKLAVIFLNSDHKFAEEGSRTIPQFLALASWCDGKLAEHESQVKS